MNAAVARRLGVHAAITVADASGPLPVYVERDVDTAPDGVRARLRQAMRDGGLVVLVGTSSVGKTRCAFEAVQALMPAWWLVHPADAAQLQSLADQPLPKTVVWLDELQTYLDGKRGLTPATVRTLLGAGAVLVASLWPKYLSAFTSSPPAIGPDPYRVERRVLQLAEIVHIDAELSEQEHERACEAAATDARIRLALEASDYGMTQVIAAAPQLIDRWHGAEAYARAVLTAAVDASRLGVQTPLSAELLRAAAPGYCSARQKADAPSNWFETALAYATETLKGAVAALEPVAVKMGEIAGYVVADYLLQYASAERRKAKVPASTWESLVRHLTSPSDQVRVGESAYDRLLYGYAETLWQRAVDAGDAHATYALAALLEEQGREEELRERADAGDAAAIERLADVLANQGRLEELRRRVEVGDQPATEWVAVLLAEQGKTEGLRQEADAGNEYAAYKLAGILTKNGQIDDAISLLRTHAESGRGHAANELASLLAKKGQMDEAVSLLRPRADAGGWDAACRLAQVLTQAGNIEELIQRADGGDRAAANQLADLLSAHGLETELKQRADAGDQAAIDRLADLLAKQGRVDELRERADIGERPAAYLLARLLGEQGREEELRNRADACDRYSIYQLAQLLSRQKRTEEAIALLRTRAEADDWIAAEELAELLAEQGQVDELRERASTGDHAASYFLPQALIRLGRSEEAHHLRRFGLSPEE
ncbi:hypothetical protein HTZ77_08535 [Nonomuraea sp. SMC257]|uniref:Tetratricopeptide repeat protein n=1 Tax=Nonomuraea montanisoli TaxID=2741721 RepID=A0A7Y6I4B5_9ACTN|nr:hypothetical protein [Nonomuraea montanisoli]NUW31470.1 hypothetical protein [Nonomuraea montanisoli]